MVRTAAATEPEQAGPVVHRRSEVVALVAALTVGVALGCLGWVLPTVGGSLATPTLIVFGIGAGVTLVGWVVASFVPQRRAAWVFAVTVGLSTVLATVWTIEFSLPAAVALDADASQEAQQALLRVQAEPKNAEGVRPHPCQEVSHGSIGPLEAPYQECAVSVSEGRFVTFRSPARTPGGLTYTESGLAAFADECVRHLVGSWWMFSPDTSGIGDCGFGYWYYGGGP